MPGVVGPVLRMGLGFSGRRRTLSNSTRLFTFSFILPLDHFCVAAGAPVSVLPPAASGPHRICPTPHPPRPGTRRRTFFF
jgi:hypothetical protein